MKAVKAFAKENIGPTWGPTKLDLCYDDKKAQVNKFMGLSASDLAAAIKEKDDEMAAAKTVLITNTGTSAILLEHHCLTARFQFLEKGFIFMLLNQVA